MNFLRSIALVLLVVANVATARAQLNPLEPNREYADAVVFEGENGEIVEQRVKVWRRVDENGVETGFVAKIIEEEEWKTLPARPYPQPDRLMPLVLPSIMEIEASGKTLGMEALQLNNQPGHRQGFQKATGILPDQAETFKARIDAVFREVDPLLTEFHGKMRSADTPEDGNALAAGFIELLRDVTDKVDATLQETLSPEQVVKLRELMFHVSDTSSNMLDLTVPPFEAFKALSLSEEQQKRLDELRDAFFKENREDLKELIVAQSLPVNTKERFLKRKNLKEKLQKKLNVLHASIIGLLTAEQLAKYEYIIKNPPEFLKPADAVPEDEEWKKSWKPGDPLPESVKKRTFKGGFPLGILTAY